MAWLWRTCKLKGPAVTRLRKRRSETRLSYVQEFTDRLGVCAGMLMRHFSPSRNHFLVSEEEVAAISDKPRCSSIRRKSILEGGGAEGVRTPDLLNAIQALYQLSYDPNQSGGNLRTG